MSRIKDYVVYSGANPVDLAAYKGGNLTPLGVALTEAGLLGVITGIRSRERDVLADLGLTPSNVNITGGNLTNVSISNVDVNDFLDFGTLANPVYQEGRVFYDFSAHTLCYYNDNSEVTVNVAQEQLVRVRNATNNTIPDGTAVYVNGAQGQTPTIELAIASSEITSRIIGVTTDSMPKNTFGYVTVNGVVNGFNTNSFADGAPVYLSSTVAGGYTSTAPSGSNYSIQIGVILHSHTTQGKLLVFPQYLSTNAANIVGTLSYSQIPTLSSAWNGQHLVMGTYHFWVDGSGRLLVKNGAPTSINDGSIVGLQS